MQVPKYDARGCGGGGGVTDEPNRAQRIPLTTATAPISNTAFSPREGDCAVAGGDGG